YLVNRVLFSFISEFTNHLTHIPGAKNTVADALSRVEALTANTITAKQLRDEQMNDADVMAAQGIPSFQLVEVEPGTRLVCKVENKSVRPLVPATLRRPIFDAYHQLSQDR